MKLNLPPIKALIVLSAAVLMAMAVPNTANAATALQGSIALRPLTPQDKKDYSLPNAQGASGLNTIGLGQPAYLEALVNKAIPAGGVTNVTWTLTKAPLGSTARLSESSLGTNVPTYKMADRVAFQVAGRTLLSPDVTGQYTVAVQVDTVASGSTNITQVINAGTYLGVQTCALCHSGGIGAPDMVNRWSQTAHSTFFKRAIDGLESDHYGKNCISCHTVGFDASTNSVNGGFDDVATTLGWTFPTNLTSGNWDALPSQLKNLSNIQCENCH
jgi:mono/diheme cytochrome c family protein